MTMKSPVIKAKTIALTTVILLIVSIVGLGLLQKSNKSLKTILSETKLKTETLLSEKLMLDKQIEKFKNELAQLNGKNKELDKYLIEANNKLGQKETEINALKKQNLQVKSLKKELADLAKIKSNLENQIASLNLDKEQLMADNSKLNKTNSMLQNENLALNDKIKMLSALADNYRVESNKGNKKEKLTINSKRTKKLMVGFDIPQNIIADVQFKITTPQGKVIASKEGNSITTRVIEDGSNFLASNSGYNGDFEITKRIEMAYEPKEKLTSGIYQIDIYNKDLKIGSCQIKLK